MIIEHPQRAGNAVHGRLTGHQQIESNQRVRVLRRAVPVCEGVRNLGICTAGQSMSDMISGHSVEGTGMTE